MVEKINNLLFTKKIEADLKAALKELKTSSVFVLADTNTRRDCLPLIEDALPDNYDLITIDPGEENKSLTTCIHIWQALTDTMADRQALLINLGGGVICDMGGFCARTYKRGINFWNIPTTVLSQVDASVGGKLGIDFGPYKNHIGLFSDPELVFIDNTFFNTLEAGEKLSGFAEMVKHAIIHDLDMFTELRTIDIENINWSEWVSRSVAIKKSIVDQDPTEQGLRKILNFGHTIGHAIESYYLDKQNSLKHGEAIAIGMIMETYLSSVKKMLSEQEADLVIEFLLGVFPQRHIEESALNEIIENTTQDKKNVSNRINAVLLNKIGQAEYDIEISGDEIRGAIRYYNQLIK